MWWGRNAKLKDSGGFSTWRYRENGEFSFYYSEAIGSSRRSARSSRRRFKRDSGIHHPSDSAIASNKDTEQEDLKHGDDDPNEAQASQPSSS